jgi:hypothetical protein
MLLRACQLPVCIRHEDMQQIWLLLHCLGYINISKTQMKHQQLTQHDALPCPAALPWDLLLKLLTLVPDHRAEVESCKQHLALMLQAIAAAHRSIASSPASGSSVERVRAVQPPMNPCYAHASTDRLNHSGAAVLKLCNMSHFHVLALHSADALVVPVRFRPCVSILHSCVDFPEM